jgi:methyl-accepting chemotaxis protein
MKDIKNISVERYAHTYLLQHPELFKDNIISSPLLNESSNVIDNNFKDYVLNALKNLKSKLKTLTIVVGNSNNSYGYSVYSGKAEAMQSGFGFMVISGYKIIYKDLSHPNKYIYIDLRDLSLHFENGSLISGITNDPYDLDDSKILTSFSLKDIVKDIKQIIEDVKEFADSVKGILDKLGEFEEDKDNINDDIDNINDEIDNIKDEITK